MEDLVPAVQAISLETTDPAEFELALRPWELLCKPRCVGDFLHKITALTTSKFTLYCEQFKVPVHVQGVSPHDTLVIGAPIYTGRDANYWGADYAGSCLPSTLAGPLDVKLDEGHYHQVAIIALPALRASMSEETFERLVCAVRTRFVMVSPAILKNYTDWGTTLLKSVETDTAILQNYMTVDTMWQELLQHLSLISGAPLSTPDRCDTSARQRGFLCVLDYLRGDFTSLFSMADICEVAGISERSLQYAFQENFGVTPYQYIKRRRFHAARQEFINGCHKGKSISQVATKYGFYELGRFSVEYRNLFGESPSESRARI